MIYAKQTLDRYLQHRRIYEILLWTALFLIQAIANSATATMRLRHDFISFVPWEPVVWEFSSCLTLLALVPAVLTLEHRFPIQFGGWKQSVRIHMLATVPFSLAHVTFMVVLRKLTYRGAGMQYNFGDTFPELIFEYLKDGRTYAVILGSLYAYRFFLLQLRGEARLLSNAEGVTSSGKSEALPQRFLVRKLGKEFLVAAADIEYLEACGNYVNLHVRGRQYPIRSTMAAIELLVDPKWFRRVHRSYIVNLDQLEAIEPLESGDARLTLRNGTVVPCSRRYREALRHNLR